MIYFGYSLDIHGWKTKPETEPDTKPETETENRGWETIPKSEPAGPETRGYPTRTRSAAISRHNSVVLPFTNGGARFRFPSLLYRVSKRLDQVVI
jgi:hypothetical protein